MKTSPMNPMKHSFIEKLNSYFKNLPFDLRGKKLCICLSGGADSVSLLRGMLFLQENYGYIITACHFNHLIRGAEADRDEFFCKELCKKLNVEIYCGADDVPARAKLLQVSLEDAARKCRYEFFQRVIQYHKIDYCVTAHNINDDAETLLLNLIRGTGVNGASSIAVYNEFFLRPMLKIFRGEIEDFLVLLKQDFVNDSTNFSDVYRRNYIRHAVIPKLEEVNPSIITSLSRFIDACREDRAYFDKIVAQNLDGDLRNMDTAIRKRIIVKKIQDLANISANHEIINELNNALFSDKRIIIPLSSDYEAIIYNGQIHISSRLNDDIPAIDGEILKLGDNEVFGNRVSIRINEKREESNIVNKIFIANPISFDNIKKNVFVRNRRTGDKITINGINKSVKKLFIDKKIPKEYRNIIPIIYDELGIIYIPFVGIADRAKSNNFSKNMYISVTFNTIDKERWNKAYEK